MMGSIGFLEFLSTVPSGSFSTLCVDLERLRQSYGGETGIRTLDTLRYTRFPSVRLQPLGHLSARSQPFDSTTCSIRSHTYTFAWAERVGQQGEVG